MSHRCSWYITLNYTNLQSIDLLTLCREVDTLIVLTSEVRWCVVTFALAPLTGSISQGEAVTINWHYVTPAPLKPRYSRPYFASCTNMFSLTDNRQKLLLFLFIFCSVCSLTTLLDGTGERRKSDTLTHTLTWHVKTWVVMRKTRVVLLNRSVWVRVCEGGRSISKKPAVDFYSEAKWFPPQANNRLIV